MTAVGSGSGLLSLPPRTSNAPAGVGAGPAVIAAGVGGTGVVQRSVANPGGAGPVGAMEELLNAVAADDGESRIQQMAPPPPPAVSADLQPFGPGPLTLPPDSKAADSGAAGVGGLPMPTPIQLPDEQSTRLPLPEPISAPGVGTAASLPPALPRITPQAGPPSAADNCASTASVIISRVPATIKKV